MQYESKAQESLHQRVIHWSGELFGEMMEVKADQPVIEFWYGPIQGKSFVASTGDELFVGVICFIGDVIPTSEMKQMLLEINTGLIIGACAVNSAGQVVVKHSVLGDLTGDAYKCLVKRVALVTLDVRQMLLTSVNAPDVSSFFGPETRVH